MPPKVSPDFNPEQNPFESILAGMGQGQAPQGGMPAGMPQGMPPMGAGASAAGGPQAGAAPMQGQPGMPGQNPQGGTKFLISALQNLHQYLGAATDQVDVAAVRGLIQIMTRLISRDQENMMKASQPPMGGQPPMGPGMPPAGGAPKPPMPAGK